jgi:hypothetical protein
MRLRMETANHPSTSQPCGVFDDDRRCSRPGCITVLCVYNSGPECFAHTDETRVAGQQREAVERDELFALMERNYGVGEPAVAVTGRPTK